MRRDVIADLAAFLVVAEEKSFTRAATRLGVSQSGLSQIIKRLEDYLDIRLIARTTRSVAPTEAGSELRSALAPVFDDIEDRVEALNDFRDRPTGHVRITSVEHAARRYLLPALTGIIRDNPDLNVEIITDYGLTDIVADRFDAGVRLGEQVEQDMVAVRISPDIPMAIVGSPEYFVSREIPKTPHDLRFHQCINLRMQTSGAIYAWKLSKNGKAIDVRLEGQLVFNSLYSIIEACLAGAGLACLPVDEIEEALENGLLTEVLSGWADNLPAYHLYYPSRKHHTQAFKLIIDAVRFRD